jgi:hypothetical protein
LAGKGDDNDDEEAFVKRGAYLEAVANIAANGAPKKISYTTARSNTARNRAGAQKAPPPSAVNASM